MTGQGCFWAINVPPKIHKPALYQMASCCFRIAIWLYKCLSNPGRHSKATEERKMTEFKGTPAPWAVEVMPSGAVTVTAGQFFVAGDGCGLAIENAKLIAAAPDLLAALQKLHASLKSLNDCGDAGRMVEEDVETARAAIALVLE